MSRYANDIRQNKPHIAGCPICYIEGDMVVTKDGIKEQYWATDENMIS